MTGFGMKDWIKRSAMKLCVKHGVDAVSMRDIAEASGIRASSIYSHFPSRDALLRGMFADGYADYAHEISTALEGASGIRDEVVRIVGTICDLQVRDKLLFDFLILVQHGQLRAIGQDVRSPVEVIVETFQRAADRGDYRGSPVLLAAAVIGTVVQVATFELYGRSGSSMVELREELVAMCLKLVAE